MDDSLATDAKKPAIQCGAEIIREELDLLNSTYMNMVHWTSNRLKDITAILSEANVDMKVIFFKL